MPSEIPEELIEHLVNFGTSEQLDDGVASFALPSSARSGSSLRLHFSSRYEVADSLDDVELIACLKALTLLERLPIWGNQSYQVRRALERVAANEGRIMEQLNGTLHQVRSTFSGALSITRFQELDSGMDFNSERHFNNIFRASSRYCDRGGTCGTGFNIYWRVLNTRDNSLAEVAKVTAGPVTVRGK